MPRQTNGALVDHALKKDEERRDSWQVGWRVEGLNLIHSCRDSTLTWTDIMNLHTIIKLDPDTTATPPTMHATHTHHILRPHSTRMNTHEFNP